MDEPITTEVAPPADWSQLIQAKRLARKRACYICGTSFVDTEHARIGTCSGCEWLKNWPVR